MLTPSLHFERAKHASEELREIEAICNRFPASTQGGDAPAHAELSTACLVPFLLFAWGPVPSGGPTQAATGLGTPSPWCLLLCEHQCHVLHCDSSSFKRQLMLCGPEH